MNRYVVLEAYADGERVQLQGIDTYATITGAFVSFPPQSQGKTAYDRLWLFDTKRGVTYNWIGVQNMMVVEQLQRIQQMKSVTPFLLDLLKGMGYINRNNQITGKGNDHLAQHAIPPAIELKIAKIKTTSQMKLK